MPELPCRCIERIVRPSWRVVVGAAFAVWEDDGRRSVREGEEEVADKPNQADEHIDRARTRPAHTPRQPQIQSNPIRSQFDRGSTQVQARNEQFTQTQFAIVPFKTARLIHIGVNRRSRPNARSKVHHTIHPKIPKIPKIRSSIHSLARWKGAHKREKFRQYTSSIHSDKG